MKRYKHSGSMGDLIYSLPIVKHFGGGEFYLHLNQINWIGKHYYNSQPDPFHRDRLNQDDFEFMYDFMSQLPYINKFDILSKDIEITHNLDRFRPAFVGHPCNYIDLYCTTFKINDEQTKTTLRNTPWLSVQNPKTINNKTIVINRTERWLPKSLSQNWQLWREQGKEDQSIFLGLEKEYELFKKSTGWDIPFQPTDTLLSLAEIIAGCTEFIGNQSQCLSLAVGLGKKFYCEARQDLPLERNECYFPYHPNGTYF